MLVRQRQRLGFAESLRALTPNEFRAEGAEFRPNALDSYRRWLRQNDANEHPANPPWKKAQKAKRTWEIENWNGQSKWERKGKFK